MKNKTIGYILMLCGIVLLGTGIFPGQVVGPDFGDLYINGQKIELQTSYSLSTKDASFQYIPTEQYDPSGSNLLSNPGFEVDADSDAIPDHWWETSSGDPVGFTSWDIGGYEGTYCVKSVISSMTTTYGLMGWMYASKSDLRNSMLEATTYQLRFAYKTSGYTGENAIRVIIRQYAAGYVQTATETVAYYPASGSWTVSDYLSFTTASGSDWTATTMIDIRIALRVVGELYLDSVELFQSGSSQPSNIEAVRVGIEGSALSDTASLTEQADNSWLASYSFQNDGEYSLTVLVTTASVEETALTTSLTIATEPGSETSDPAVTTEPEISDVPTPTGTTGFIDLPIEAPVGSALGFGLIAAGFVFVVSKQSVPKPKKKK